MANDDSSAKLRVKYQTSPQYRTYGATGAYGGLSPNGEIVIDFFVERQAPPDNLIIEITDGCRIKEKGASFTFNRCSSLRHVRSCRYIRMRRRANRGNLPELEFSNRY